MRVIIKYICTCYFFSVGPDDSGMRVISMFACVDLFSVDPVESGMRVISMFACVDFFSVVGSLMYSYVTFRGKPTPSPSGSDSTNSKR